MVVMVVLFPAPAFLAKLLNGVQKQKMKAVRDFFSCGVFSLTYLVLAIDRRPRPERHRKQVLVVLVVPFSKLTSQ